MILSVVIPCYNHGKYLQEAIDSVLIYKDKPIEILIVDDGSTDLYTIEKINALIAEGFKVIRHKNTGLAFSRNAGILQARGKYILPLDADNKIKPDYIKKALPILESNLADIIYAKPIFFGEVDVNRIFEPKQFNGIYLISGNYIDACSIYNKQVWIKNKGYDTNMPQQGHEDWEFWLNAYFNGSVFYYLEEELYYYRIDKSSMITKIADNTLNHNYIFIKYQKQIIDLIENLKYFQLFYENDQRNYFKTSIKYLLKFLKDIIKKK